MLVHFSCNIVDQLFGAPVWLRNPFWKSICLKIISILASGLLRVCFQMIIIHVWKCVLINIDINGNSYYGNFLMRRAPWVGILRCILTKCKRCNGKHPQFFSHSSLNEKKFGDVFHCIFCISSINTSGYPPLAGNTSLETEYEILIRPHKCCKVHWLQIAQHDLHS